MSKYFKIISAICAIATNFSSFAMMTRVKSDPLSGSFYRNNEMRGYLRQEQAGIQARIQARIDDRKQFESNMGQQYRDLQYIFHRQLFNGNAKVASICLNKPFAEAMEVYTRANNLKKKYPIAGFGEQHYAVLTEDEAVTLSQMKKEQCFYDDKKDVDTFVSAYAKLRIIDPEMMCLKSETNRIQYSPSVKERMGYFWNAEGSWVAAGPCGNNGQFSCVWG